jgi:hypothetical protein
VGTRSEELRSHCPGLSILEKFLKRATPVSAGTAAQPFRPSIDLTNMGVMRTMSTYFDGFVENFARRGKVKSSLS